MYMSFKVKNATNGVASVEELSFDVTYTAEEAATVIDAWTKAIPVLLEAMNLART